MANCTRNISVDNLYMEDNVRTDECMHVKKMVESLRRHGFLTNHPLRVSKKPDGRCLVLAGNRRTTALLWLKENDPDVFRQALPGGKVPCVVDEGLTVEEEIRIRVDHSEDLDREPLDDWSIFDAIRQLSTAGFDTQEEIAVHLGLLKKDGKPRREYVQVRVNLSKLPKYVRDEFRKLCFDRDSTPVRWSMVSPLYKVWNLEFLTYSDGNGPEFRKLWQEKMTPPNVTDGGRAAKALTPAEAVNKSQSVDSSGLREAILAITRQGDANLVDIDRAIIAGETAVHTLQCIREYLGEKDYSELTEAAHKQHDEKNAESVEVESVEAEPVEA